MRSAAPPRRSSPAHARQSSDPSSPCFAARSSRPDATRGRILRFRNAIPQKLVELAILVTARHVDNAFEWILHQPLARKEGLAREAIDAINERRRPGSMAPDEAAVHDFVREMLETSFVGDATYARVLERFGEQGVVDLTGTVGYFVAVCYVMNVAGTPPPQGDGVPLAPIRR